MSFQSFITEKVAALTASINAIATNAKKIDELPAQNTLDPASKIHVSRSGISEYIPVQKIIDAINNNTYNQLLSIGEITLVDNVVTVPLGATWQINEIVYNTISDTDIPIPYAATGLIRKDILIANTLGQIVLVSGDESAGIAVRPNIPIDTVLVTEMDVTDVLIGDPTPPVTVEALATKLDKDGYSGTAKDLDNRIATIENPDVVIQEGIAVVTGSTVDIDAEEFIWRLDQVEYTNTLDYSQLLPAATDGYIRTDIFVGTKFNTIERVTGVEAIGVAVKPEAPINTIELVSIDVEGANVSQPAPAINGDAYISKSAAVFKKIYGTGSIAQIAIIDEAASLRIMEATDISSLYVPASNKKHIFSGKDHYIRNNSLTDSDLTINNNTGTGNYKYLFHNGLPLVLKPNEIAHFKIRIVSNSGFLDYVGIIYDKARIGLSNVDNTSDANKPVSTAQATAIAVVQSDIDTHEGNTSNPHSVTKSQVGLSNVDNTSDLSKPISTATQLALDSKLDSADYNDRFKGVYLTLSALNAAHPTGSAGDSAQVNETGSTDVVNYSWDAEESIWVQTGSAGSGATNTDALPEGTTNLYWTVARFLANLTSGNIVSALGFTPSAAETATTIGALIGGAGDATPNDSDFVATSLTTGGILKKITWTNAKAFLKTYFDTLYKSDTISLCMSDTSSALVTGDTDPMQAPYNFTLVSYWVAVKTAPTVSSLIVDIKKNGTSVTSTKAGIDATEKTSLTGTSPVLTTTSFTKGDEITPNIYQVGSSETGRSLKLYLEIIKT